MSLSLSNIESNRPFKTMVSFYCCEHNPPGFGFLVKIEGFVIQSSVGLSDLNMKEKTK